MHQILRSAINGQTNPTTTTTPRLLVTTPLAYAPELIN